MKKILTILLTIIVFGLVAQTTDRIDVKLTSPANNQYLKYEAATRKWINATLTAGADSTYVSVSADSLYIPIAGDADNSWSLSKDGSHYLLAKWKTGGAWGTKFTLENDGDGVFAGDITILGDDITATTNTIGAVWVGDGTNFNPVVLSTDATVAANGAVTVVDDSHNHVIGNIDSFTSAALAGQISDETGSGLAVFNTTPIFSGNVNIGAAVAVDTQSPDLIITGDADSDGAAQTTEALTIELISAATPTNAYWKFGNTQSQGYYFDDDVHIPTGRWLLLDGFGSAGEQTYLLAPSEYRFEIFNDGDRIMRSDTAGGDVGSTTWYVPLAIDGYGLNVGKEITQGTNLIRKVVYLTGATDNVATEIFTVTTTNETGDVDGGAYSISVHLLGTETVAAATAANASAISLTAHWTRLMLAGGTGTTSAVTEISESAANDLGTGAITAITITTAETSEYVSSVLLDINTSGGTFSGYAIVELVYHGFTTAPVISD